MACYSALSRKETLTRVTTWMSLKDVMLGERGQIQKDKYCMVPFQGGLRVVQILERESRMAVARAWGRGEWRGASWDQSFSSAYEKAWEVSHVPVWMHLPLTQLYLKWFSWEPLWYV